MAGSIRKLRALAAAVVCLIALGGRAHAAVPLDELGAEDPARVAAAVTAIEATPAGAPELADALFAAARACEDSLADPPRALALYDRILRELPDARVTAAARRRAGALRGRIGGAGEHAREAGELARLIAGADQLAPAEVELRADALAAARWPGAPDAALWLAEWLRRHGRFGDAVRRNEDVLARWPGTAHAVTALRNAAGAALDARAWDRAESLALRLPSATPTDRAVRDDLLDAAARGRRLDFWYAASWLAVLAVLAALIASLAEACLRGGRARPSLRPPIEVLFLAPVAAVLIGAAFTAHRLIAPAVTALGLGGLALAYLSGATLDTLRARGRATRARSLLHIALCTTAAVALLYIAITRDNLLDMLIETVAFGPEP